MFELDEKRAKECYEQLLRFLDFSARSEKELKEKLYQKGYHQNEVDFAIDKAKKYKFIDDEAFCRSYILTYKTKTGRQKIEYKLINELGVDSSIVSNLLDDLYPLDEEIELCRNFALKYVKLKSKPNTDIRGKLGSHLFSKGFSYSVINRVVSSLNFNIDNDID